MLISRQRFLSALLMVYTNHIPSHFIAGFTYGETCFFCIVDTPAREDWIKNKLEK